MICFRKTLFIFFQMTSLISFSQLDSTAINVGQQVRIHLKKTKTSNEPIKDGIYLQNGFQRFRGKITFHLHDWIQYDQTYLRPNTDSDLKMLFTEGIIYPSLFLGDTSGYGMVIKTPPDSLNDLSKLFFHAFDSITVFITEDKTKTFSAQTTKRFSIWLFKKGFANAEEYFIELTNDLATKSTNIYMFVIGSRITYIRRGGIII